MPNLTLAEAEKILAASKAKVLEMGLRMSISVVDPQGRPHIYVPHRQRFLADSTHIQGPRRWPLPASASLARSSGHRQLPSASRTHGDGRRPHDPVAGGVPVYRDGVVIGAVGAVVGPGRRTKQQPKRGSMPLGFLPPPDMSRSAARGRAPVSRAS